MRVHILSGAVYELHRLQLNWMFIKHFDFISLFNNNVIRLWIWTMDIMDKTAADGKVVCSHVKASFGKIVNPELPPMLCHQCTNVCEWLRLSQTDHVGKPLPPVCEWE